ncbi:MAG: glycosyltransferase [Candidatus Brocadiaceae bacterium]|nr:glycosyltransferase [Candidatus Brocadiaceae bacterium]
MVSVIIPTRNRAKCLKVAIESISGQSLDSSEYEIIVMDNGSTDDTARIVNEINVKSPHIRYYIAPEPGLHVGRHLGARMARGDILAYVDDDIIATPDWLLAIRDAFKDPGVAMVGGKILPKWEGDVPDWVDLFKVETEGGWTNGYLSLLDLGDTTKNISALYVYGCNFSIRKPVLFECEGFHPDGMPHERIQYRGDGETALSRAVMKKKYKTIYEPRATVYHLVPPERLTIEYFCLRAFNQGVSDSYAEIRRKYELQKINDIFSDRALTLWDNLRKQIRPIMFWRHRRGDQLHTVKRKAAMAYEEGILFHRKQVKNDPELLEYIVKKTYL